MSKVEKLVAKFQSRCTRCAGTIARGTSIQYEKGVGSWHEVCPAKGAPKATSGLIAQPSVEAAPYEVGERWEPCTGAAQQARLVAVVGETRRYTLRPSTRRVRGEAPQARYVSSACSVCNAAPFVRCSPPDGTKTREEAYYVAGQPSPPGGWPRGPVCITAGTPDHDEPVSESDQRRNLPGLRDGAGAVEGAVQAQEPGVYVVVGVGKWRFQNAEDNEDMGNGRGANWSGPLYLRRATAEEVEKDAARRMEEAMPQILDALGAGLHQAEKRQAEEAMAAAAERPGYARTALDYAGALDLTEEDIATRQATRRELWHGRDRDYSYVCTWTWRGQEVWETHRYIYDWDQPTVYVGPEELVERAAVAQMVVGLGYDIQRAARRMDRVVAEGKAA